MSNPIKYIRKHRLGHQNIIVPWGLAVRRGEMPDVFSVQKFGENETLADAFEMIWSESGAYTWMTTAQKLKIASVGASGGNDDGTSPGLGSGARTIELQGLDANYNIQTEILALNGTTAVTSAKSYIRFFRGIIKTAGNTGYNEGAINIYDNGGAAQVGHIPIQYNQTMQALYTIPTGYTAYLTRWYGSSPTNQTVDMFMFIRPFGEVFQVKHKIHIYRGFAEEHMENAPVVIPEKSDIYLAATPSGSVDIAAGFDLVCIK
jgi:hypothetical protein